MRPFKYKAGDRFGNWLLLENLGGNQGLVRCDCGTEKVCWLFHLASGKSTRCKACYGASRRTAKFEHPDTYSSWGHMIQRCLNPNCDRFYQYGGRGITVCDEWRAFDIFLADMGPRPPNTSLDRIDVNGPYNKENCRWATPKKQMRNQNRQKKSALGVAITEAAENHGLPYGALQTRLRRGWSVDRALNEPIKINETTVRGRARKLGLPPGTIDCRVRRGWDVEKALSTPIKSKKAKCG